MGKKSRRNKKNNAGSLRKGLAAVPTAPAPTAATPAICCETLYRLLGAKKYDEVLEVESKYRHLDTFSDDPAKDVHILHAFGCANNTNSKDEAAVERAIHYYERAKERIEEANAGDQSQSRNSSKLAIGMNLAVLYSADRDMEKAISSHRWLLVNCSRHQVSADYVIELSSNFNRFEKFEYAIEVMEEFMDMMETFEEEFQAESNLICAYIGCGDFPKAKAVNKKRRSTDINWFQSGNIESGLCNYEAAIAHYRKFLAELQEKQEYDSPSRTRIVCSVVLAKTLLQRSAENEAEAFAIFQEELDRCVDPLDREEILIGMGTWFRKVNKFDQSIEALHQLCLSATGPHDSMLPRANKAIAQTYLEQYCTDTTLDIDQRTAILRHATEHSNHVDEVSTKMHLTRAQLFYFNGNKQQAYYHLELYLDARLVECKLRCYTCDQRVGHRYVPVSCASCKVASYCDRQHQKLTYKNERICHKVLCPLLGHWRMAKKKQKKHQGLTNEDRRDYRKVADTFFESICPHVKTSTSSYYDGLIFID